MKTIRETLSIAIFVSLAAQISFSVITDGFIIALSVVVMTIFIYCYENLSATYIAICSGIFSPIIRLLIMIISREGDWSHVSNMVLPDMVFFISYGCFYPLIYTFFIRGPKTLKNFPYAIFFCEILANLCELMSRSYIAHTNLIVAKTLAYLVIIAFIRTAFVQTILIALESYSNYMLKRETDEEYKSLMAMAALVESELYIMKKCAVTIENIMKQSYDAYRTLSSIDAPEQLVKSALNVSQQAHEVKGDFLGILNTLEWHLVDDYDGAPLPIKEIINIEKKIVIEEGKSHNKQVEIKVKTNVGFSVKFYFMLMSIFRNLFVNAVEASDKAICQITAVVDEEGDNYTIKVTDNGAGMDQNTIDTIFLPGFSTKFNPVTGNMQRGIGLSLVKEYVESHFCGSISIESELGKYSSFLISIPKNKLKGIEKDEVLHS